MCDMALELPDEVPCCIENVFYEFGWKVVPPTITRKYRFEKKITALRQSIDLQKKNDGCS